MEWGMWNAECRMLSEFAEVQESMRIAVCGMWNAKGGNEECGMRNVECEMWRAKRQMWDVGCEMRNAANAMRETS